MTHIKTVQEKINAGTIIGEDGLPIQSIDFAVPSDIAAELQAKVTELELDVDILPINATAGDVADIVQEGFDNMGQGAMENFFGELFGSSVTATALHAITNSFLVYKGPKASEAFLTDTIKSSSISVVGFASGMSMEMILNQIAWIGDPPTSVLVFAASIVHEPSRSGF